MSKEILVDGKELPHKIGDSIFWLYAKDTELSIEVREEENCVDSIKITSDGIEYLDHFGENIESDEDVFWSREEAQKWLDEHMPEKLSFKKGDFVLFISQNPASIDIDCGVVDELAIEDKQVKYRIRTASYHSAVFTEDDINNLVFFDREKAIEVRDKMRSAKEILCNGGAT